MLIILDTNVLIADPTLSSGPSVILLDYVHRTQSDIAVSSLVFDEFLAWRHRWLESQWHAYFRAANGLKGVLPPDMVPSEKPDLRAAAERDANKVFTRLGVRHSDLLAVSESHLREAMRRAVNRVAPCTERGEETRDAVVWQQVRDQVNEHTNQAVAFVSHNTKQFADGAGQLLPALKEELRSDRFAYYSSLDEFAKQQAAHIEFVTEDWLTDHVSGDEITEAAVDQIRDLGWHAIRRRLDGEFELERVRGGLDLDEFYVYVMEDQSLRVEMSWYGQFTFEGEEEDDYRYGYDGTGEYGYSSGGDRATADVAVRVRVTGTIRAKALVEWHVTDVTSI
jgi:hypothetical protein